ncbi:MAG: hypothetical protein WBA54_06675 [Acidaminobacteraceae bacterium]
MIKAVYVPSIAKRSIDGVISVLRDKVKFSNIRTYIRLKIL